MTHRSLFALCALLALGSCDEPEAAGPAVARDEPEFENFQGTTDCLLADQFVPETEAEALEVVRWAIDHGHRVRAVSSPASHSESDIVCPGEDGVLINFFEMDDVLEIDAEAMEVTVEPGIQMGALGQALHEEGFGLAIHIPITVVTAAGTIGTGAHHSSLHMPSGIQDMVTGLRLIDCTGELVELTGDDARHASVHLGVLGAITAVTFRIRPQYKTRAGIERGSDENLHEEILDLARAHDHASVSWFPSQGTYLLRYHDIVGVDTPGEAYSVGWRSSESEQNLIRGIVRSVNNGDEDLGCQIEEMRYGDITTGHEQDGAPAPQPAVGFSHRMWSSNCEGQACPWNAGNVIYNPEVAIDAARLGDWIQDVRQIIAADRACFPVNGILIRFSQAGESWLGMNAGHDVAHLEYHIAQNTRAGHHEAYSDTYDEIHLLTLRRYDGRPHWGKNYPASFVDLDPTIYPRWDDFMALRERLDPNGVFEGDFFRRLVGQAQLEPFDGCAVTRECFCTEDAHCGEGARCGEGVFFTEARVCRLD